MKYNLAGQKFSKLTVLSNRIIINSLSNWECICDCGNIILVKQIHLLRGYTKSCGCLQKQIALNNLKKAAQKIIKYTDEESICAHLKKGYNDTDLSLQEFISLIKQNCTYCGAEPSNAIHYIRKSSKDKLFYYNGLDRVDNSKPHTKDNVVPCCFICNRSKRERSKEDFINHMQKIYSNMESKVNYGKSE